MFALQLKEHPESISARSRHGWHSEDLERNSEIGIALLEVVIALSLFALVGIAVLVGTSTIHSSGAVTEEQSLAENIARNQMERLFSEPYQPPPSSYTSISVPSGYNVAAAASEYVPGDTNIERIIVTITHQGQHILTLETLRTNY